MRDLHEDKIMNSLRERLGRYEEAPSDELWGKIAAAQKEERVALWPLMFAALAVVGVLFIGNVVLDADDPSPSKENIAHNDNIAGNENAPVAENIVEHRSTEQTNETIRTTQSHQSRLVPTAVLAGNSSAITEAPAENTGTLQPTPDTPVAAPDSLQIALSSSDSSTTSIVIPPYKKPKKKFQLYFSATPSLSFQKIIPSSNDQMIVDGFEPRSPLSIKRFGFALDAGFQKDINHIFGYYGGLSFYRQHQELTYTYFDEEATVTRPGDEWIFDITRTGHTETFDYSMTNLGVRAGLLVTLKGEKLKHKFGAGMSFMQGIAKSAGSYNNSRSSYLAYQVFYRNEVTIDESWSWYVEPNFNYSFRPAEKLSEPFRMKPYRAGISVGVLYRF